jgi:hypothetical protein
MPGYLPVSKLYMFEHNRKEMVAVGLRTGDVVIKSAETLKNNVM